MQPVSYVRPTGVEDAISAVTAQPSAAFLAGGTTEIDLLRLGVTHHDVLVDINRLPLAGIEDTIGGGVRIGALTRMTDAARHRSIVDRYPAVSQALLLGASEQLRNMATIGGNLCQQVRCAYFRDGVSPCNKRVPGTGCSALSGFNRGHAILGVSDSCIATHPSDVAVALVAFDAKVHTRTAAGARTVPIDDFYLLPEDTPDREHPLEHGELIVSVDLPTTPLSRNSVYVKFRDRQSYEFALVSVAAALAIKNERITDVRLALGGVGTKPWRARHGEAALIGEPPTPDAFAAAAAAELADAVTREQNAFKVEFAERAIIRVLTQARRLAETQDRNVAGTQTTGDEK